MEKKGIHQVIYLSLVDITVGKNTLLNMLIKGY